ncbi:hypothetical protein X965_01225 [Morganella sp. EGD-HP17]|nr:hypothetical protein X965_01225 [Morganella sp. EGD-HP17]
MKYNIRVNEFPYVISLPEFRFIKIDILSSDKKIK